MRIPRVSAALIVVIFLFQKTSWSQQIDQWKREGALSLLQQVGDDVKKHYYDPTFHGIDWDGKVRETKGKIEKADTYGRALSEIAAMLDSLNDSHTFLIPPQPTTVYHDYGWRAALIGDSCFITHVRPGSDAEAKGVKPGDQLIGINGYATTRANFSKVQYFFKTLRPQPSLRLALRDSDGKNRTVEAAASARENFEDIKDRMHSLGGPDASDKARHSNEMIIAFKPRVEEVNDDLMILKLPSFFASEAEIDSLINRARHHKTLIIDLRDNGGGSVEVLEQLLGRMFPNKVKIGERVGRESRKVMETKAYGKRFEGKLTVLVDSWSASASELFARVVQIEKRGLVLGDVSSGKVMESVFYPYRAHPGSISSYGSFITDADIIMTDGRSLEGGGVRPDEIVLPNAADLAANRDPVLSRAAELAGVKMGAESAGKLFPFQWPPL
jgi:carboxyl-terminal processing protease